MQLPSPGRERVAIGRYKKPPMDDGPSGTWVTGVSTRGWPESESVVLSHAPAAEAEENHGKDSEDKAEQTP